MSSYFIPTLEQSGNLQPSQWDLHQESANTIQTTHSAPSNNSMHVTAALAGVTAACALPLLLPLPCPLI